MALPCVIDMWRYTRPACSALLQVAAAYDDVVRPISAAAAAKFLQDVRNDTLGGVPVTIGTPRGMPQANADKILVYAHGGAWELKFA